MIEGPIIIVRPSFDDLFEIVNSFRLFFETLDPVFFCYYWYDSLLHLIQ